MLRTKTSKIATLLGIPLLIFNLFTAKPCAAQDEQIKPKKGIVARVHDLWSQNKAPETAIKNEPENAYHLRPIAHDAENDSALSLLDQGMPDSLERVHKGTDISYSVGMSNQDQIHYLQDGKKCFDGRKSFALDSVDSLDQKCSDFVYVKGQVLALKCALSYSDNGKDAWGIGIRIVNIGNYSFMQDFANELVHERSFGFSSPKGSNYKAKSSGTGATDYLSAGRMLVANLGYKRQLSENIHVSSALAVSDQNEYPALSGQIVFNNERKQGLYAVLGVEGKKVLGSTRFGFNTKDCIALSYTAGLGRKKGKTDLGVLVSFGQNVFDDDVLPGEDLQLSVYAKHGRTSVCFKENGDLFDINANGADYSISAGVDVRF